MTYSESTGVVCGPVFHTPFIYPRIDNCLFFSLNFYFHHITDRLCVYLRIFVQFFSTSLLSFF